MSKTRQQPKTPKPTKAKDEKKPPKTPRASGGRAAPKADVIPKTVLINLIPKPGIPYGYIELQTEVPFDPDAKSHDKIASFVAAHIDLENVIRDAYQKEFDIEQDWAQHDAAPEDIPPTEGGDVTNKTTGETASLALTTEEAIYYSENKDACDKEDARLGAGVPLKTTVAIMMRRSGEVTNDSKSRDAEAKLCTYHKAKDGEYWNTFCKIPYLHKDEFKDIVKRASDWGASFVSDSKEWKVPAGDRWTKIEGALVAAGWTVKEKEQ